MNYLKELNAFYQQLTFNPVSASAGMLWNTLMHFNNLCGWKKEFAMPATALQLKAGLTSSSFKRARKELCEKGYIYVKSRGANQAALYQMISQIQDYTQADSMGETVQGQRTNEITDMREEGCSNNFEDQSMAQQMDEGEDHEADQQADHNVTHSMDYSTNHNANHHTAPFFKHKQKQNKTGHKQTKITDAIRFYHENFGIASSYVADDMINWTNDVGDPLVIAAMKRALEQNKASWGYAKGILSAWVKKGITTLEQVEADEAAFCNQRQNKRSQKYIGHEVVPEWFQELKKEAREEDKRAKETASVVETEEERQEFEDLLAEFTGKGRGGEAVLC